MEMIVVDVPVVGPLRAGARTSEFRGRHRNEDAHLCGPTWLAVADGIDDPRAAADRPVEPTLESTARDDVTTVVVAATGDAV